MLHGQPEQYCRVPYYCTSVLPVLYGQGWLVHAAATGNGERQGTTTVARTVPGQAGLRAVPSYEEVPY